MQRNIFDSQHTLFRDAFRAFLGKEVLSHQDAWEEAGMVSREVWRKAFDRPISHFQNTRFKLAEMRTQIDVAQVFVERCVMDHNQKQLTPEVAAEAKLFTTEQLGKVVDEGVQLHGGWGYMWECPICKRYANARIQRIFAGTSEIMKEIISRGMKL